MIKLLKYAQNQRIALFTLFVLLVGIGLTGCQNTESSGQPLTEASDEKLSVAKIQEAEPLYAAREDLARARVAVFALRQARTADSKNYEAAWKLARAAYFVADHTEDTSEQGEMFDEGVAAGKGAIKLQPDKPEGHFWLGANIGGKASHATLADPASFQEVKKAMETVLKLDEGFQEGSAYIGLGRLYLEAPSMIGGDTSKAISYLEKGLKFGSNSAVLHAFLAEAYQSADRDTDAKKQVEIVNSLKPDPQFAAEYKDALARVKKVEHRLQSR
jgi:TPR repeat protein